MEREEMRKKVARYGKIVETHKVDGRKHFVIESNSFSIWKNTLTEVNEGGYELVRIETSENYKSKDRIVMAETK